MAPSNRRASIFPLAVILYFFALFLTAFASKPSPSMVPPAATATVLDWGIYDATVLTSGNWKLGIPVWIVSDDDLKLRKAVARVPAEDGSYFGFRATFNNPSKTEVVSVRSQLEHPMFTNPDGTSSSRDIQYFQVMPGGTITQEFLWFFLKSCPHEFVPGAWTWHISIDHHEVIKKEFQVYKP
ncbi:MAG: DUF3859 domain-containing protein [Chthoniobacteraceae bacterium]